MKVRGMLDRLLLQYSRSASNVSRRVFHLRAGIELQTKVREDFTIRCEIGLCRSLLSDCLREAAFESLSRHTITITLTPNPYKMMIDTIAGLQCAVGCALQNTVLW